ncbi:MAG: ACT domain-containing protein [Hyphomonadaceae bacterium]
MSGETSLEKLLSELNVYRHDGVWEFVSGTQSDLSSAVMKFREREGWTHIVPAARLAPPETRFVWLELAVHSDLNAVGFLAKIAQVLADEHIPCNAVAACFHDHIFVPEHMAERAIGALERLSDNG